MCAALLDVCFGKTCCMAEMLTHAIPVWPSSYFGGELRREVFSLLAVPEVRVWCPVTPFKSHPPHGARSGSLYLEGIADIVADSQASRLCHPPVSAWPFKPCSCLAHLSSRRRGPSC